MSYCRMGVDGSDVYCYQDIAGHYVVWADGKVLKFDTALDLLAELQTLRGRGVKVPEYAFDAIKRDSQIDGAA